jgi:hypothetical protein
VGTGNDPNALSPAFAASGSTTASLQINPGLMLVVIFSPNLAYRGTVMSASAVFEKFSHRMTPTVMELTLTLRLYSIGEEPTTSFKTSTDLINAQNAVNIKGQVDPTQVAPSQQQADDRNAAGRMLCMQWGEYWLPGGHGPTGGVIYDNGSGRCAGVEHDDIDVQKTGIPQAFDCSSFVGRCMGVVGWASPPGQPGQIGPPCYVATCSSSEDWIAAANSHPEVWESMWLRSNSPAGPAYKNIGKKRGSDPFNKWLGKGDIIVRSKAFAATLGQSGQTAGHIAFIHDVQVDSASGTAISYEVMHTYTSHPPDNHVSLTKYPPEGLIASYDVGLRAGPVPVKKSS